MRREKKIFATTTTKDQRDQPKVCRKSIRYVARVADGLRVSIESLM